MRISELPALRVEDYLEQQSWIGRLFIQLNSFIQSVNGVVNNNIDYATNIRSVTQLFDVKGFQEFSLKWPYPSTKPIDLRIISAYKGTEMTPTLLQAAWSYDASKHSINVTRMVELNQAGINELTGPYQFTVRATI